MAYIKHVKLSGEFIWPNLNFLCLEWVFDLVYGLNTLKNSWVTEDCGEFTDQTCDSKKSNNLKNSWGTEDCGEFTNQTCDSKKSLLNSKQIRPETI